MKAVGILGGTFDPIHYGHLLAAEYARHEFALEKILLIPAARPPHKNLESVLDVDHRFKMAEIAVQDNPAMEISLLEKKRNGLSYTVDTVKHLLNAYFGASLFFILGADSLLFMNSWKNIEELATLCTFVVVTRPGYKINPQDREMAGLPDILWKNARYLEIPGLDISSSDIRRRVAQGKPIKYLLPPEVERYICEMGLYRGGGIDDR
jgi:nicotinate-nucleotide adenylyltransferase